MKFVLRVLSLMFSVSMCFVVMYIVFFTAWFFAEIVPFWISFPAVLLLLCYAVVKEITWK